MKHLNLVLCLMLVTIITGINADSDSSSSSDSDSGSNEHKKHKNKHRHQSAERGGTRYNNPAYMPGHPAGYQGPPPYPYGGYYYQSQTPPHTINYYGAPSASQYPQPAYPFGGYYNQPIPVQGPAPASGALPATAYLYQAPQAPAFNQPAYPYPTQGSYPQAPTPSIPGGSSTVNHSLKVNKEYNEDGHHYRPDSSGNNAI